MKMSSSLTRLVLLRNAMYVGLLSMIGMSMNANAGLFGFGGISWKEEVLLHDGSKIIVERSQSYGGRHEIGQTPPIKDQEITFTVPGTRKTVTWKSEYSEDIGRANFKLLALHILDNTPYVVASPNLCLSYNKWGRSNPPYVFFKYEDKTWRRISLAEFPTEFKEINVVVSTKADENVITSQPIVSAESVKQINSSLEQAEYKTILREALKPRWDSLTGCPIPTGPDGKPIITGPDGKPLSSSSETPASEETKGVRVRYPGFREHF
jgi:hypothetical protein